MSSTLLVHLFDFEAQTKTRASLFHGFWRAYYAICYIDSGERRYILLQIFKQKADIVAVGVKATLPGYKPVDLDLLTISADLLYHVFEMLSTF